MKYILFIILMNGNMVTAEFDDHPACGAAGITAKNWSDVATETRNGKTVATWFCTSVGTKGNE